jgi:hypothetical protein
MKKPIRTCESKWQDKVIADFDRLVIEYRPNGGDDSADTFTNRKDMWEQWRLIKATFHDQALQEKEGE